MIKKINGYKEYYNGKIFYGFGGGGGCSSCGSWSPTYYHHPEKAYVEAFKKWKLEIDKVFDAYTKAMEKLAGELSVNFKNENRKIEAILIEEFSKLKIKAIELESLEEDTEEIKEKKKWLDEVIKEINEILEV